MFKNIRKKLEQGVAQSKAVVTGLTRLCRSTKRRKKEGDDSNESATSSDSLPRPVAESTPQKDVNQVKPLVKDLSSSDSTDSHRHKVRSGVSTEQFLDTSERSSSIVHEREASDSRSRTSSVSSMISDSAYSPIISLSHHYTLPSDVESEAEDASINLASISKEELYSLMKRLEQRAIKYKSKFMELTAGYKDVLQEKEHLKLKLQKERKEYSEELKAEATSPVSPTSVDANNGNSSPKDDIELLKSKIKRQDGLLQKCRETITSYKEKLSQLSQDKQELIDKLDLVSKASDRVTPQSPDQVSRLQAQMQEARKVIEQLESDKEVAIAEVKQQIHEEMERKDAELEHIKLQLQKFATENNSLKLEIEKLTNETEDLRRTNQEQLEKARNIMRRLKEDKRLAIEQAEARIRQAEQSMEEEKEKMLIDLKRGKAEAFSVMQQESEKNLAEQVEAAVLKRDQFWNKKMTLLEEAHGEVLRAKDREKEMALTTMQEEVRHKLKEKEDDIRLALEERELQKMAAVTGLDEQKDRLLLQIEELSSAKIELCSRFSKFQEDSERQVSDLTERLKQKEAEHSKQILELRSDYEETLKKEISAQAQNTTVEIELLRQRHAEEIQSLMDKQEQELQESNADTESYYKNQFENEKEKLESLLSVTTDQLEDMRNSYLLTQAKLKETEHLLLLAKAGLECGKREQSQKKEQQTFTETGDLDQRVQQALDSECSTDPQTCDQPDSQLYQVCENLSKELRSVREALTASEHELRTLKAENTKLEEERQQRPSQCEQERGESESVSLQELKERIVELEEENQCLKRNVENSRIQVEGLEKCLQNTVNEKKATECKAQELEVQVGQLQEVIRTLESCQSTVEKEKASLEYKLTCLENIVEDLKSSKTELNEKLHGRHEALIQQSVEEKQVLESRADEFASQVGVLKEELDVLKKALLTTNDENVALRSVVEDNTSFINSLESKIEKLTAELQIKSQSNNQNEAALAKSQEKFEKLKNEANAKVKGLKDMKDSLTEQLNQKQKECEEIQHTLRLEQEALVKSYEEKLSKQTIEMKELEETYKDQFIQKQTRYRERINKLKEHHANILLEKDKYFEDRFKVMSQNDSGYEDRVNQLEKVKEDQFKSLEQKHQAAMDALTTEWKMKYQTLDNSHSQELDTIRSHYQQQVNDLYQQLLEKDSLTQELSCARAKLANTQKELADLKVEVTQQSEKHTSELESLNALLAERNTHIQQLTTNSETLDESASQSEEKETLISQIQSLTNQLSEKEIKLETMAGTISAEQEYLHKQLTQQTKVSEELQAENNTLSQQLKDIVKKHEAQLNEKDTLLSDVQQQIYLLKSEHDTLKEILTSSSNETQSLEECLQQFKVAKDAKVHDVESELETKIKQITSLQEEITHLQATCEQKLADFSQNQGKELDIMKLNYDSQISQLSSVNSELKTEADTLKSQLSEAIQSYETRLKEEQSKLEVQAMSYKEEINVLKQQLLDVQQQTLLQSTQKGEAKHLAQLQSHQKDVDSIKQEAEQKMKDLRQKYLTKLKEFQSQAKSTIEELENTLQIEKTSKSEMYDELTRANTRLLQLEENTGTSRNTIVDLEHKVVEMTALLKSKDGEISKLKTVMAESEKNMQEILDETETNCKQINDKLTEAEAKLEEEESNQQQVNYQLMERLAQLQEMETFIISLESRCSELENVHSQEKEKYEHELQKKSNSLVELEDLLQKTQSQFLEEEKKKAELDSNLKTALSALEQVQTEKLNTETELSQLTAKQEDLKSKLLETEITLENSLANHTIVVTELEARLSESIFQKEQIEHDNETRLNQLKLAHAAELSDLTESLKTEYQKKAEADISQMKKQLQDEQTALVEKHHEDSTKLQEAITILTEELNDLRLAQEKLISEHENIVQNMKYQFEEEVKLKQSVIDEYDQKQQEYIDSEFNLKREINSSISEKTVLLEKITVIKRENDDLKLQYTAEIEELKAKNNELHRNLELLQSDRDEELITLKAELADLKEELENTMLKLQKSNKAVLEEQANQHTSKVNQIVHQTNEMLVTKAQEMEDNFSKTSEENERSRQDLVHEHQKALNELRQEILEKDKHIEKLRLDHQSQIQSFQSSQEKRIKELQSELAMIKVSHQQEIQALETRLKVEYQDNQSKESADYQEFSSWTPADDSEQKDIFELQTEDSTLQQQVILLTRQIEQMKQEHRLELAETLSKREVGHNSSQQPFVSAPARLNMDSLDPSFSADMQNLELVNMDLQAQVSQLYGELSLYKLKEKELLKKMEKLEPGRKSMSDDDDPPLSLDGSFFNHTDSALFREPTEFEYLKNILYEYMMGRETKTLAKVIATVVRFSDEQMRNVVAKADTVGRKS